MIERGMCSSEVGLKSMYSVLPSGTKILKQVISLMDKNTILIV